MPRSTSKRAASRTQVRPDRASVYDEITDRIIAELEDGRFPWVQPWGDADTDAPLAMPRNAATGRNYSGINVLILWGAAMSRGYRNQGWLTFRQALGLGGNVRRGARGTSVVYADRFIPENEKQRADSGDETVHAIPFLKRFTVFSVDQCENLPETIAPPPRSIEPGLILPEVEALVRRSGAQMRIGGAEAFYAPALDYVQVPRPESFDEPINWHRTALHELGHWSGHSSRLARDLSGAFGTPRYAGEELVAELCAAFCCATLGIAPTVRHADYIGSWLAVLREDNRAIVRAASAASKAADYLLAFRDDAEASQVAEPVVDARGSLNAGDDIELEAA